MRRSIKILVFFLLATVGVQLSAKPVSLEEAQNVAKNWMLLKTGKHFSIQNIPVAANGAEINADHAQVRIIRLDPKAWVIVSADDVAQPILGYGESPMDLSHQPPGFKDWISDADQQIEAEVSSGGGAATSTQSNEKKSKIEEEWKRLKVDPATFAEQKKTTASPVGAAAIAPLLWMGSGNEGGGIIWDQGQYYNAKCPADSGGDNGHVYTGCVATAMGQIMRYYQLPTRGSGSHSYNAPGYGTQSANFGSTTYQWSSMPYQLSSGSNGSQIDAVATLLYHAGVSVDMEYGIYGSSAYPNSIPPALKNYFGYSESDLYARADLSDWDGWLQRELSAKRPLFYAGYGSYGGHGFVLDGYDGSGYYHFNWGWGGYQNGYYSLGDLTPGGYNFTNDQLAVKIVASSTPLPPGNVTRTDVTELYVATFLRAPDAAGLDYWVNRSGLSIEGIAQSFFDQPETQAEYPPGTTIGEFVDAVYWNLFNRSPDDAGFDYWVDELYYGRISPGLFILAVINGAQGQDVTILNNKTRVGEHYANSGVTDIGCAEFVMQIVDETEQSVQDAFAYIDNGCQ